jgi:hypothetical protein
MKFKHYRKIFGPQGSWLAKVTWDNGTTEMLPTAHKECLIGMHYRRRITNPAFTMSRAPGKLEAWKTALLTHHKIVLTESTGEVGETEVKRKGYIDIFDVENIELIGDGAEHDFDLCRRYSKT